jgi:hypothetical protein
MLTSLRSRVELIDERTQGDLPVRVLELEVSQAIEPLSLLSGGYRLVYNPAALVWHAHHADHAGVGLTAFLTKTVVDRPGRLLELSPLSRHGVVRVLDPRGGRGPTRSGGDWLARPSGLARAERRGMLYGPAGYLLSRRRTRLDG